MDGATCRMPASKFYCSHDVAGANKTKASFVWCCYGCNGCHNDVLIDRVPMTQESQEHLNLWKSLVGTPSFHVESSFPPFRIAMWTVYLVTFTETWSGERSAELVSTSETRNPKPETDSEDLPSPGPIETRNPKPETDSEDLTGPIETRNPKPETDSEDLTGPIETRNPKPETDSEDLTGPIETRSPKPETRNRLWRLNRTDRNPKPETRNPKPETDSEDLTGPIETRNPKPETRNRLWRLNRTDRNPKPETRNRLWRLNRTDRNPKPETRNPKPTLKT